MRNGRRILFVATSDPFRRSGGGLLLSGCLHALNHLFPGQVDVLLPEESLPPQPPGPSFFPAPRRTPLQIARGVLRGQFHRFQIPTLSLLDAAAPPHRLCLIGNGLVAGELVAPLRARGVRSAVLHQNFERDYHRDNRTALSFQGRFTGLVARLERNAYLQADVNLFLSAADRARFEVAYGPCPGRNVVLGVFEPEPLPLPPPSRGSVPPSLVLTGTLNSPQTVDGIRDFIHTAYPLLRSRFPQIQVILAGRSPAPLVARFAEAEREAVSLFPDPPDMAPILARASLYCCPIHSGGGVKLRVMDGLRHGLPVLTHSVSARGYDAFLAKPYFRTYRDAPSFADGLAALLDWRLHHPDGSLIQQDYLASAGFDAGCDRLRAALEEPACPPPFPRSRP